MIVTKEMKARVTDLMAPMIFGIGPDAQTLEQLLKITRDMAAESPADEQLKRDMIADCMAAIAEVERAAAKLEVAQ